MKEGRMRRELRWSSVPTVAVLGYPKVSWGRDSVFPRPEQDQPFNSGRKWEMSKSWLLALRGSLVKKVGDANFKGFLRTQLWNTWRLSAMAFIFFFFLGGVVGGCRGGKAGSHHLTPRLEFEILLPQPFQCWDYRRAPPYLASRHSLIRQ
jgi:hypothetical protein